MKKMNKMPHEQVAPNENDGLQLGADDDVEGHLGHTKGERFLPGMPGTGGDVAHRTTGEIDGDDVEGHSFGHTKGERFLPGMPGTGGDRLAVDADEDVEAHRING